MIKYKMTYTTKISKRIHEANVEITNGISQQSLAKWFLPFET